MVFKMISNFKQINPIIGYIERKINDNIYYRWEKILIDNIHKFELF